MIKFQPKCINPILIHLLQDMSLLKSNKITHILNMAAGDADLGAPALDLSIFSGKWLKNYLNCASVKDFLVIEHLNFVEAASGQLDTT